MTDPILYYGVWIPGQGWLKRNNDYVAFDSRQVAEETARRIGQKAKVYYIDSALADLETYFRELEDKPKSLFGRKG